MVDLIPKKSIYIREATRDDRSVIIDINHKAWEGAYQHIYSLREIDDLFSGRVEQKGSWLHERGDKIITLLAEVEERIVGFISLYQLADGSGGEVSSLYVYPGYQGAGIGSTLWDAGIEAFKVKGYDLLHVWVLAKAAAVTFYESHGCICFQEGQYIVGQHTEATYGYRLTF